MAKSKIAPIILAKTVKIAVELNRVPGMVKLEPVHTQKKRMAKLRN